MQPVSLRDTLSSYSHHCLIQTLAPLYSQSFATLEKLSASTQTCTGRTRRLPGMLWHLLGMTCCTGAVAQAGLYPQTDGSKRDESVWASKQYSRKRQADELTCSAHVYALTLERG